MAKDFCQANRSLQLVTSRNDTEVKYVCLVCGHASLDDDSVCVHCGSVQSLIPEEKESEVEKEVAKRRKARPAASYPKKKYVPISTGRAAWDEALGGGLVRPSTTMVHGPKGTGKTTAMLAIAMKIARTLDGKALYGTAEMSGEILCHYGERAGLDLRRIIISDAGDAENLLEDIDEFEPVLVVWDSIQAFTWEGQVGETELRNVVRAAVRATADYDLITLLVSQVTKENQFLGPSEMGHGVDTLVSLRKKEKKLYIECLEKNRFHPTPTMGVEDL